MASFCKVYVIRGGYARKNPSENLISVGLVQAPSGFEPEIKELQSSALPLGYGAEMRKAHIHGHKNILWPTTVFLKNPLLKWPDGESNPDLSRERAVS